MADTRVQLLFVLTLLQLCRAQAPDNNSESWYLANVVNDAFQPQPISEIFSTEPPFSSKNPILVLPKSSSNPDKILSSTFLPSSLRSRDTTSTYVSPLPSTTPLWSTWSTEAPQTKTSMRFPTQRPQVEITQFTEQTQPPSASIITLDQKFTSSRPTQQPTFANRLLIPINNVGDLQFMGEHSLQGGLFGTTLPEIPASHQPVSTVPIELSSTMSPTSIPPSEKPHRLSERPTTRSQPSTIVHRSSSQKVTKHTLGTLPLKIRVLSPRGGITHVNISPKVVIAPTTTTKKPTTKRTRKTPKPKKNTYEACLSGCKARREPICAIPLSSTWIDPEKLKGFPSVCHMACFNSYKKESYEQLFEGRCGKLRTRIHSFGSDTKIKREELKKQQYHVDNGEQTVVEVSPLCHK